MKVPTEEQISEIEELIQVCVKKLIRIDGDIFSIDLLPSSEATENENKLLRKLHETTINHRFAYYIEEQIKNEELKFYNSLGEHHVDIEFNRYGNAQKELNGLIVRPDIIVHTRLNEENENQHFLVIEAKKEKISDNDIRKIREFIEYFDYLFGLTISYCRSDDDVLIDLYYFDGDEIRNKPINVSKQIET